MSSNPDLKCIFRSGISFTVHPMMVNRVLTLTVKRMFSRMDKLDLKFEDIVNIIDQNGIEYKFVLNIHTITFERKESE